MKLNKRLGAITIVCLLANGEGNQFTLAIAPSNPDSQDIAHHLQPELADLIKRKESRIKNLK